MKCRHEVSEDCPACAQETIDALVKALRSLTNEVRGIFDVFEYGIRQEISNTNFAVVCDKLEDAYRVLDDVGTPGSGSFRYEWRDVPTENAGGDQEK